MAYQSEAQLEKQLMSQLSGQKFAPVAMGLNGVASTGSDPNAANLRLI